LKNKEEYLMQKESFKDMADLLDKLKKMISEKVGLNGQVIDENKDFVMDYGVDSLDLLLLISDIEDLLRIKISNEDAVKLKSFSDVKKYVESKYSQLAG
jgi:acyl carrier protein